MDPHRCKQVFTTFHELNRQLAFFQRAANTKHARDDGCHGASEHVFGAHISSLFPEATRIFFTNRLPDRLDVTVTIGQLQRHYSASVATSRFGNSVPSIGLTTPSWKI